MFFAVILRDKTNLCVPASWVCAINPVYAYNYGVNHNEKKRIFFSGDDKTTPNFLLPLRTTFHFAEDSCYLGQIKKTFGTKAECLSYYHENRIILPAVYSNNREHQGNRSSLATEKEIDCENERLLQFKQEKKFELEPLRRAIRMLNTLVPKCDLTQSDECQTISISDDESDDHPERMPGNDLNVVLDDTNAQVVFCVKITFFSFGVGFDFVFKSINRLKKTTKQMKIWIFKEKSAQNILRHLKNWLSQQ